MSGLAESPGVSQSSRAPVIATRHRVLSCMCPACNLERASLSRLGVIQQHTINIPTAAIRLFNIIPMRGVSDVRGCSEDGGCR